MEVCRIPHRSPGEPALPAIRPGSISPPVWDAKSTEQSVSSVLPGSSGHSTASASPEGREKGEHKHSSSVTISSTALQQWCIEQPAEDNGFEILLPPPHPIERFGGEKREKKEKMKKRLWVLWRHLLHPRVAVLKPSI